jgi:hypothetical protein
MVKVIGVILIVGVFFLSGCKKEQEEPVHVERALKYSEFDDAGGFYGI